MAGLRASPRPARVRRRGTAVPARARRRSLRTPEEISEAAAAAGLGGWHELARFCGGVPGRARRRNAVDFAGAAAAGGARPPRTASRCSTTCSSTTTRTRRWRPRRSCAGSAAPDLVVAGDPDAHVFSFQGTTRRAARPVRTEAFPGAERIRARAPAIDPSAEPAVDGVDRAAHLRGARRDRPRAASAPRGGRRRLERPGRRGPAPGRARRRPAARARRRAGARASSPSAACRWDRAGHAPVRARAPVARRRRAGARASSSNRCSPPTWSGCRRRRRAA